MNEAPETTQFDVNLPKPRTHKVLIGVLVAVLVLGTIGVAAAAIANRTAQSQGDATAAVMPPNTMMYFSLNTHADQLPNFNVIADAWKDSKEAKMVMSGLEVAFAQSGLNWEDDIQPWLGERIAMGMIDFGGMDQAQDKDPSYRTPFFVIAAQTKDRVKSDAALGSVLKQVNQVTGEAPATETYRGIPITYLKSGDISPQEAGALATINDVIVLTLGADQMKAVINAALDGQNLATSANYKVVMSSLPGQNAGAVYMDYNRYMDVLLQMTESMQSSYDSILSDLDAKQAEQMKQQREKMQAQQAAQMAQLREMMKAMGGIGATMSYEPTGVRFDTAMQFDPAQMPAEQRQMYESALTPASGKLFASLPASAVMAVDFNLKGGVLNKVLNPDLLAAQFASLGVSKEEITAKLDEFQKLLGVNLQTDVIDLMNGDAGFALMTRDQQKSDAMSYSMPVELAVLLDSSDAGKLMGSFDKVMQGLSALSPTGGVKTQSLSGLPYSAILIDDKPVLTYGVVDGRFVIGTDSNTLLGIDNADQNSLSNEATFKQATGLLPSNRLNTAYLNFQPLWNLINAEVKGTLDTGPGAGAVLNYLSHFKWMSTGAEAPANGLSRGSLHIGVGQ
jgi:hypothetical protein